LQKSTTRARLLASSLLCSVVLAGPGLVQAQTADNATVEEVVVTGSRIKRDTFSAPSPIATVSSETITESGNVILGDVLMDLPMVNANSNGQNTSSTLFNAGQARIDLRGLGASRTLVLVDGRRHVFSDAASPAVDLNMIPSLMVERIDVVPGAGSAVYGSEAIAGVVNLLMIKKFDGLKLDVQSGVSQEGDGAEYRLGALWGGKFLNEKLNVVVGGEFARQDDIMQANRDWAIPGIRRDNRPGITSQPVIKASRSNTSPYATFQLVGGSNAAIARAVTLDVRNPTQVTALSEACRTPTVLSTCQDESLIYSAVLNQLQGEVTRGAVRGYADYALTDNVKVFGELSYARAKAFGIFQPAFSSAVGGGTMPVTLKGDNAYMNGPGSTAAQLRAAWLGAGKTLTAAQTAQVGKFWVEFGGRNVETDRETIRGVVGMNGDFNALDRDFSWDWYGQFGKTTGDTTSFNVPNVQKVQWATDAVLVGGNIVCRATTVAATAAAAAGCQPWDLVNGASKAAIDYTNAQATSTSTIKQTVVAGNITTDLFTLPAGKVGVAVGAEYRKEESSFVQDPVSAVPGTLFFNAIGTRAGEYTSKDAYGEIRVPVLKDLKWTYDLSLEAAGRISDYSTIGTAKQWRLAGEWAPIRDIRFRANKGTSVRAPNIVELFSPQSVNFTTAAQDPCDKSQYSGLTSAQTSARVTNCSAAIAGYNKDTFVSNIGTGRSSLQLQQGGNPDLEAEKATTTQIGVVLQPRFMPGFQLAFDWYKSDINGEVGTIPIQTLLTDLCYNAATAYASNPFCAQVVRDATGTSETPNGGVPGGISRVVLLNQNVAAVKIEGWDSSAQYQFPVAGLLQVNDELGDIALRVDVTRQYHWKLQGLPGQDFTELANAIPNATPEWKANMSASWSGSHLRVQWQTRFIGSMAVQTPAIPVSTLDPYYTEDHFEHDLRATYRFNDKLQFRGGVVNVTNERPPFLPETFTGTGTGSSTYDNRGRFFFLGASMTY
jgi:outer membrane receptor protein involved in Fe transport